MVKTHLGYFVFHNPAGEAVGIGEKMAFDYPIPNTNGGTIRQEIIAASGITSDDTTEVTEREVKDIREGHKLLSDYHKPRSKPSS
jgi:hypothetical protein